MALKIVWSPRAIEDADAIANYIAEDSPAYARAVIEKIVAITRRLKVFPLSGRVAPELNESDLREQLVHSYRLIYRVRADSVLIVTIIHGRRLLPL